MTLQVENVTGGYTQLPVLKILIFRSRMVNLWG